MPRHRPPLLSNVVVDQRLALKGYERRSEYLGSEFKLKVFCTKHNEEHDVPAKGVVSDKKNLPCCGLASCRQKMTGRPVTQEFKEKCAEWQRGDKAYWSGKELSKNHRENISRGGIRAFSSSIDRHIEHALSGVTSGKPGYFYIIKVGSLLKLGSVSRMTPEKRMAKIRRDTGKKCKLLMSVSVKDAGGYEASMFNALRQHWIRGEYFKNWMQPC